MATTPQTIIFHPLATTDQPLMAAMKTQLEPRKGQLLLDSPGTRPVFDTLKEQTPAAPGVTYAADTVGGVPGWWCRPTAARDPASAVLFLHGGAYVLGSAAAFRHLVGQLAAQAGVACFVPDYRLAPEHPFPAAVDDAWAAYQGLVARGKQRLAVAGDSAGGGLALVTVARAMRAAQQPGAVAPRAAVVFSPWTDLALTSASMRTRAEADFLLTPEALAVNARYYLRGHDAHDALASPVYGDLAGLPPVHIHVGDAEVLLDDAVRYAEQLQAAGGVAELHVWEGLTHVFIGSVGTLAGANEALDLSGAFLARHLA